MPLAPAHDTPVGNHWRKTVNKRKISFWIMWVIQIRVIRDPPSVELFLNWEIWKKLCKDNLVGGASSFPPLLLFLNEIRRNIRTWLIYNLQKKGKVRPSMADYLNNGKLEKGNFDNRNMKNGNIKNSKLNNSYLREIILTTVIWKMVI